MKIRIFLISVLVVLSGCSADRNTADLRTFVDNTLNKPRGRIEPIPVFKPYEYFRYSASGLRSPFELPLLENAEVALIAISDVRPDDDRTKEYLEQFPLGGLQMVGTLQGADSILWALVRDSTGNVVRVKEGNFMGHSHGRITSIDQQRINLIEIVPNGLGGWIERPRVLALDGLGGE